MMKRIAFATICAVTLISSNAHADLETVTWNGVDGFNDATITFAGFYADTLVDVDGNGIYHDHGRTGGTTVYLDILVDGTWVNIWTDTTPGATGTTENLVLSDEISTPIVFAGGLITGLRLTSNPDIGVTYHSWSGMNDTFTFDTTQEVPEPTTMALWGLGTLGFGALARRRRRKEKLELSA